MDGRGSYLSAGSRLAVTSRMQCGPRTGKGENCGGVLPAVAVVKATALRLPLVRSGADWFQNLPRVVVDGAPRRARSGLPRDKRLWRDAEILPR